MNPEHGECMKNAPLLKPYFNNSAFFKHLLAIYMKTV